jgi:hypothetical protein
MTIGIYYIATSNYKVGFKYFKENLKYLFPTLKKKVLILSDGLEEWDNVVEDNIIYKVCRINHLPWPIVTLFKMKYIIDYWDNDFDYVFYFNGNLQYNKKAKLQLPDKLIVSTHVMGNCSDVFDGHKFAKIDKNSVAFIEEPYKYIHGGLFYGPSTIVKKMCREVCKMCETDLKANIIPQWHDESYLNKWCVDNNDLVLKENIISYNSFSDEKPFAIIETINKDRRQGNVYLPIPIGRFGNNIYEIMAALTYCKRKNKNILVSNKFLPKELLLNIDCYDEKRTPNAPIIKYGGFESKDLPHIDGDCIFYGYFQNVNLIDEDYCKSFLKCPKHIETAIYDKYPDIEKMVCLHVRRGDYLHQENKSLYRTLSVEYINKVIEKYYPNEKIICISDDIEWCEDKLSHLNVIFSKNSNYLIDFYIQTLTKGNICSCSSFSCAGALLNSNKECVVPTPYYKDSNYDLMVPKWAKREEL